MKTILIVELDDDVNLDDVSIRYVVQDIYGMPLDVEVDGVPLKKLPQAKIHMSNDILNQRIYKNGFNTCLGEIISEEE